MWLSQLPLHEQAILFLASVILFTCFGLLAQTRVVATLHVFAWQGGLLSLTTALVAFDTGQYHLYISAALTLLLKGLFIPWLLHKMQSRLGSVREQDMVHNPALVLLGGAVLVVFCYHVSSPIQLLATSVTRPIIAVSMAMVMLGMLMLITRHKAVSEVVGFMVMENGLFFAAVSATHGMPMVVELGVAFDVLIAAIIFGVFFLHLRESFDSLDVDQLSQLTESEE